MKKKRKIIPYKPYLKELARKLRNNSTLSEILLWKRLSGKQMLGYDFHRQKPMDKYIVDFYAPDLMLVIEIDGRSHDFEEVQVNDATRQAKLEDLGVSFLRFSDLQVKTDINNVLRIIQGWVEDFEEKKAEGDVTHP